MPCTSIIVGKEASIDGSILVAKEEDITGDTAQQIQRVERVAHRAGEMWTLMSGRQIPHDGVEYAHIQYNSNFDYPGARYNYCAWNPNYLNEHGVITGDDAGAVREENKAEFPEAGIYAAEVKHIMGTRGRTAREAIEAAGELIDKYGFGKSGSGSRKADGAMYFVADADEGWWMEVVTGHHWVAQRCPDDAVMMRANSFRIGEVDLKDKRNFMGSKDLIEHAVEKGWYDPDDDGSFNFSRVYGQPESLASPRNRLRELMCLRTFAPSLGISSMEDEFPESMIFHPDKKVSKEELMTFMRTHYEGTEHDSTDGYRLGNPHHTPERTICTAATVSSVVAQLRGWLPTEIGSCLWVAQSSPCISVFVPWYLGIKDSPEVYRNSTDRYNPDSAWWRFKLLGMLANMNYKECIELIRRVWAEQEKDMLELQDSVEKTALELYEKAPDQARDYLTSYCFGWAMKAYERAGSLRNECIRINAIRGK